jgi:hypothetical protein
MNSSRTGLIPDAEKYRKSLQTGACGRNKGQPGVFMDLNGSTRAFHQPNCNFQESTMRKFNFILRSAAALACLTAFQAQAAFGDNPDLYGHVLVNPPMATTDALLEPGMGDGYGSVLLDQGAKATTDKFVERGMGDTYGSILLDIRWHRASMPRTAAL